MAKWFILTFALFGGAAVLFLNVTDQADPVATCIRMTDDLLNETLTVIENGGVAHAPADRAELVEGCDSVTYAEQARAMATELVSMEEDVRPWRRRELLEAPEQIRRLLVSGASCADVRSAITELRRNELYFIELAGALSRLAYDLAHQARLAAATAPDTIEFDIEALLSRAMQSSDRIHRMLDGLSGDRHSIDNISSSLVCAG